MTPQDLAEMTERQVAAMRDMPFTYSDDPTRYFELMEETLSRLYYDAASL